MRASLKMEEIGFGRFMLVPHFSRLKTGISMIDLFQKKGISMMNLLQKQQYAAVLAFKFCLRGINVSDQLRNNFLTLENPSLGCF